MNKRQAFVGFFIIVCLGMWAIYENWPIVQSEQKIRQEILNKFPVGTKKEYIQTYARKNYISPYYLPGTSSNHFDYIISKVIKKNNDKAFFKTAICLSLKANHHIVFLGEINGRVSLKAKGENGFGYDPIFIPKNSRLTFGEMKPCRKYKIDHRYMAFKKIKKFF